MTSDQRKLFQGAREDNERIRGRPDLIIRIFDVPDLLVLAGRGLVDDIRSSTGAM